MISLKAIKLVVLVLGYESYIFSDYAPLVRSNTQSTRGVISNFHRNPIGMLGRLLGFTWQILDWE